MKFIFTADPHSGIVDMSERIVGFLLENKSVLWLLAGGSNIPIAAEIMNRVREKVSSDQMIYLTLALTDERYGPVGHVDSNWHQLTLTNFDFSDIQAFPILHDVSLQKTVLEYAMVIERIFQSADVIIGQFGIGADGHIAGILPHSPALESAHMVHGYVAEPFTRITLTVPALKRINISYTFAFGISKGEALLRLKNENVPIVDQPAQVLKTLPEAYVYQDVVN